MEKIKIIDATFQVTFANGLKLSILTGTSGGAEYHEDCEIAVRDTLTKDHDFITKEVFGDFGDDVIRGITPSKLVCAMMKVKTWRK